MKNKFNEAYIKIISEQQMNAEEEKTNYVIQVEYLQDHGFKPERDDSGYGVDWIKQQGNFQIVINMSGKNFKDKEDGSCGPTDCEIKAEVRYVKTMKAAVLFRLGGLYHLKESPKTANEAVAKCAAFIGGLRNEIDGLGAW